MTDMNTRSDRHFVLIILHYSRVRSGSGSSLADAVLLCYGHRSDSEERQATHVLADDEVVARVIDLVGELHDLGDGDLPLGGEAVARRLCGGLPKR